MEHKEAYLHRLRTHILLVNAYAAKLDLSFPAHDNDKIYQYFNGYSLSAKSKMTEEELKLYDYVSLQHVTSSSHHPEFWTHTDLSDWTRSNPTPHGPIECKSMPKAAIIEMCCDWCATAEEHGNTPMEWFEKVNDFRWIFTERQKKWIKSTLEFLWEES